VDVVSDYITLRKSGRNYSGFCPFHDNTRTPAFAVSQERQTWRCYGACAEGGDIFSFVMKKEGIEFPEALKLLAARAGVELPEYRPKPAATIARETHLATLLDAATNYFHHLLLHAPEAAHARAYLAGRDLHPDTIRSFRLGYALRSWDACTTRFSEQGYSRDDLLAVGLVTLHEERQTVYDRFRDRILFPIQTLEGQVAGFGARTLQKDGIPKYLNSPQSETFDKSRLVYGLDRAWRHIRAGRQAVIVEGYMDVIRAHQAGYHNVVAQMGTSLTEPQLTLLKAYTKRFVIALDADEAGQQATLRSLAVAREALDKEEVVRFDARGLLRHEQHLKADIHVVTMPDGQDPDDVIRADPEQWPKLVAAARPIVAFVTDMLTRSLNMGDARAKSEIARQVVPLINDIADPVMRSHYRHYLAERLGVDERALQLFVVDEKRPARKSAESPRNPARSAALLSQNRVGPLLTDRLEADYLRHVLRHPALLVQINLRLKGVEQAPVSADDFEATEDRQLWPIIRQRAIAPAAQVAPLAELRHTLDKALESRLATLLPEESSTAPVAALLPDNLPQKLALSVLNWRLDKIRRELDEVKQLLIDAQSADDHTAAAQYNTRSGQLKQAIYTLHQARRALSPAPRRSD
jgi:DNA primase